MLGTAVKYSDNILIMEYAVTKGGGMVFGGLSVDDAIRLYFQKRDAIKRGDLATLREIKNNYPQLFNGPAEQEIIILLDYVTKLRQNPDFQKRYSDYCKNREKAAKDFALIKSDDEI